MANTDPERTRLNNAPAFKYFRSFTFVLPVCDHPWSFKFAKHYLELFFVLLYNVYKCLRKYRESTLRPHAFTDATGIAARSAIPWLS